MFNSFAFSQASSSKRIEFNYEIASGSPINYTVTNNLTAIGSRRSRLEVSTEGFADAGNNPGTFLQTTTAGTASIIFDRANMMQYIEWITTGDTDTIVGGIDLSSENTLRDRFSLAGHDKLTGITFNNNINPLDKSNSALTLVRLFNNDLRNIDLSGFKNIGEDASTASIQIYNNFNCSAVTFPSTNYRTSISMRNLNQLTEADFTPMPAMQGVGINNGSGGSSLSAVTFAEGISASTGSWDFNYTDIHNLDLGVIGSNFGARIDIAFNSSLTAVTFPACQDSVVEFFMRGNGLPSDYVLDLTPMSGISGDITIRNQSLQTVNFAPSSNLIDFFYMTANGFMTDVDLSPLSNLSTTYWNHSHTNCTAVTVGNWTGTFTTFYMFAYPNLPEIQLSGVTGLGGQVLLHDNPSMTACTLPETTNTITELWFRENDSHGYLDMKPISAGTNDNIFLDFDDNPLWTAAVTNETLVDIDNFGWTGGTMHLTGTTALWDSSSGGFDGQAAYESLTGKSWTIITS